MNQQTANQSPHPGNRTFRRRFGPIEVYAYHDYPLRPWVSPLYAGVSVGPFNSEAYLSPDSPLRPFSGGVDE